MSKRGFDPARSVAVKRESDLGMECWSDRVMEWCLIFS